MKVHFSCYIFCFKSMYVHNLNYFSRIRMLWGDKFFINEVWPQGSYKHKALLCLKYFFLLRYLFCLNSNLIKTIFECLHYEDTIFYQMKYDLRGHGRSHKALLTKHIHLSTHFEKYFYEATNFSVYVQRKKYWFLRHPVWIGRDKDKNPISIK